MTGTAAGQVEVVRVDAAHLEPLAKFYRQVWDPSATAETVAASRAAAAAVNPANPGEPPPTWLVLRKGQAIGHVTTIPIRLWLRGEERPAHWVKGLWVLPEFQRSAAGFLVLKEAVKALPSALALVHEPAARRLFEALKFADFGRLPNAIRVLRAGSLLRHLDLGALGLRGVPRWMRVGMRVTRPLAPVLGPVIDSATGIWTAVAGHRSRQYAIRITDGLDADAAEELWLEARAELAAAPRRGGPDLAERYGGREEYQFVEVRAGSRLTAVAVVRRPGRSGDPRLQGLRVATLSDLLFLPSRTGSGVAALAGAEQAARGMGADALLAGASAAATAPLLHRRGYLSVPANLHVLGRFPDGDAVPARIAQWWFTRGDSGGDGSF